MPGKPLSNVDTAWLRMEEPDNLMMITGLIELDKPVDYECLKQVLENTILVHDRFRQRPVQPWLPIEQPYWEDVLDIDMNYHLQQVTLPPPGDKAALQKLLSEMMSTQLDFTRPLWQYTLVDNYGNGSAIIARLHHCIADGIALVQVLLSMTTTDPRICVPDPPKIKQHHRRNGLEEIFPPVSQMFRVTETLIHEGVESLINPKHFLELAKLTTKGARALARLLLLWPDPPTIFKGPLVTEKHAAWSEPIDLQRVKDIGKIIDGTVNDVLLTVVSGALRRYMEYRQAPTEGINFRAVVPVNLRPPGEPLQLGNKFGLVFLSLPIYIADPLRRLGELKRRMDSIKNTPEALVAFGILNTIGMTPQQIQDIVVDIFGLKGTAVMTNVPGPQMQLYLAGAPLRTVIAWVPQSGHLGLGVSIISYNHKVWLGIATDSGLVPDPEKIVALFNEEFEDLVDLSGHVESGTSRRAQPMMNMINKMMTDLDGMIDQVEEQKAVAEKAAAQALAAKQKANAAGLKPSKTKPKTVKATQEAKAVRKKVSIAEVKIQPVTCQAQTKECKPCKNQPLPGSIYCRVHQKALVKSEKERALLLVEPVDPNK